MIPGTFLVSNDIHTDSRGSFENLFTLEIGENLETQFRVCQVNLSRNYRAGTLRGLHIQKTPAMESKLVSCIQGEIFDVMVDLRRDSEFFGCWQSVYLRSSESAVYVPKGVAHGFQTLTDNAVIQYLHSGSYVAALSTGVKFDDSDIQISWPREVTVISENDANLPTLMELRNTL